MVASIRRALVGEPTQHAMTVFPAARLDNRDVFAGHVPDEHRHAERLTLAARVDACFVVATLKTLLRFETQNPPGNAQGREALGSGRPILDR